MNTWFITFCTKNNWGDYYTTVMAKDRDEAQKKAIIKYGSDWSNVTDNRADIANKKIREHI